MDTAETTRIVGYFRTLKKDCEDWAEVADMAADRDPSDMVDILAEAANQAMDLRFKILNALLDVGSEVDPWRSLIDQMQFTESYRIDTDFRRRRDRPHRRHLKTAAEILDTVCKHLERTAPTEQEKPRRRRGPKPDMERHGSIASIVNGRDYRMQKVLKQICHDLDSAKIPIPNSWRRPGIRMTWVREMENKYWNVVKAIQYSLDKVPRTLES
jgi:hypothetical protein